MGKKKRRRKMIKAIITVSSILVFAGLCVLGVELWLPREVRRLAVENSAKAGVDLDMGRVRVSILARSISIFDLSAASRNDSIGRSGAASFNVDVARLTVSGVGVSGIWRTISGGFGGLNSGAGSRSFGGFGANSGSDGFGKKPAISVDKIEIFAPHLVYETEIPRPKTDAPKKDFVKILTAALESVEVREIAVTDIGVDLKLATKGDVRHIVVGGGDLRVDKFRIDSTAVLVQRQTPNGAQTGAARLLFSDNVRLAVDSVKCGLGLNVFRADTLAVDLAAGTFSLVHAALIPIFSKHTFAQKDPRHRDWTEILARDVQCRGIDFAQVLAAEKTLSIDSVSLAGLHIGNYKNKKIPAAPRIKPMLYETIQNVKLPLIINHLTCHGFDVHYEELDAKADSPGTVILDRGVIRASNVTNIAHKHGRFFTVDIQSRLMHGGTLKAVFKFPISPSDDHWEAVGSLGKTDAKVFNAALEPMVNMRMHSGTIEHVDFRLTGTKTRSHVAMTMVYNNLNVGLLRRHDHTKERKFVGALANVIVKSDNPARHGKGKLRSVEADFNRDPYKSMYNYLWHSLLQGIKKTVL
jgi:hypothetical protein